MMKAGHQRLTLAALSLLVPLVGCSKKSGSDPKSNPAAAGDPATPGSDPAATSPADPAGTLAVETGTVDLNVRAVSSASSFTLANTQAASAADTMPGSLAIAGTSLTDGSGAGGAWGLTGAGGSPPSYAANSITSGAPDGFKITVVNIAFTTTAGVAGTLNGGVLNDPSLTNASAPPAATLVDGAPDVPPGAGNGAPPDAAPVVAFKKADGATISVDSGALDLGALAGEEGHLALPAGTYHQVKVSILRQAQIKGCVSATWAQAGGPVTGAANVTGVHKYCTVPGYGDFDDALGTNAIFENATPQFMPLDLGDTYAAAKPKPTDTLTYTFALDPPLVVAKGSAVDLSLVFDLNRMLRYYNQNRIDQGAGPSAPHDRTYFFNSVFSQSFFAFVGAPGRVYGYQWIASNCPKADYNAAGGTCASAFGTVGGWMTIITAPSGAPLVINLMPDDDNDLTIIKGGIAGVTPFLKAGSTAGRVDILYALGTLTGTIQNFDPALDGVAVGSQVDGVSFDSALPGNAQTGSLYVLRGL